MLQVYTKISTVMAAWVREDAPFMQVPFVGSLFFAACQAQKATRGNTEEDQIDFQNFLFVEFVLVEDSGIIWLWNWSWLAKWYPLLTVYFPSQWGSQANISGESSWDRGMDLIQSMSTGRKWASNLLWSHDRRLLVKDNKSETLWRGSCGSLEEKRLKFGVPR